MRREYAVDGCAGPLAVLFGRHHDQCLGFRLAAANPGLGTAQIALVYLDRAQEPLPARPDHGASQLVQARPGGLVAAPAKYLLQPQRADAVLLAGYQPHGPNQTVSGVRVSWKTVPAVAEI